MGLTLAYLPSYIRIPNATPISSQTTNRLRESLETRPHLPSPFLVRSHQFIRYLELPVPKIEPKRPNPFPPWNPPQPIIITDLMDLTAGKANTSKKTYQDLFNKMNKSKFENHAKFYTDGSKREETSGCSVIYEDQEIIFKLPNEFAISSCEAFAIDQALDIILETNTSPAAILTDSKTSLDLIKNTLCPERTIQNIQRKLAKCLTHHLEVSLVWIPSHQDITGNEKADKAAKKATLIDSNIYASSPISGREFQTSTRKAIKSKWNEIWTTNDLSKLHYSTSSIFEKPPDAQIRKDQCAITRLRIGHTNFTHRYLFEKSPKPVCEKCNCPLSVEHLLVSCPQYRASREKYNLPQTLKKCLSDINESEKVIKYCKETKMYEKL